MDKPLATFVKTDNIGDYRKACMAAINTHLVNCGYSPPSTYLLGHEFQSVDQFTGPEGIRFVKNSAPDLPLNHCLLFCHLKDPIYTGAVGFIARINENKVYRDYLVLESEDTHYARHQLNKIYENL